MVTRTWNFILVNSNLLHYMQNTTSYYTGAAGAVRAHRRGGLGYC